MNRVSTEEVLNKAYRLAYFLHQEKDIAIRIVAAATLKLNVAMAVQSKRLYYIPVGRFSHGESRRTDGIRNKALFSDLHLLQRLVYGESEPYERQKERAALAGPRCVCTDADPASEEDLLVYFIKHLVRITTKRNAFYVTLGVSRLLHNYSTLETMEIYNAVIGEPERVKDDYYYRSRKAVLMHELCQRFGELIRARRQRRGEERFETQQSSSELRSLMRECLRLFTPWDTHCPVPHDFDPFKSVIAALTSKNSADENKVEVSRIHAILHPDCFERLVTAFGYCSPSERMELPRFFSNQTNDQSPPRQRSAPTELNAEELAEIDQMLAEQGGRRRRSSPTAIIRIMVDGVERGRMNPVEQSSISFSTDEDAEIIEVKTTDPRGDLLLATYLLHSLGQDEHDAAIVSSIRLEGGQELSLSITRRPNETNDAAYLLIKFGYRETNPLRVARLWWQRLRLRLIPERGTDPRSLWGDTRIPARYILVGAVVLICLAGFVWYLRPGTHQTGRPSMETTSLVQDTSIARETQVPDQAAATASERSRVENRKSTAAKSPAARNTAPRANAQSGDEEVAGEELRSGTAVANLTLSEVRKIYIEVHGDAASNELRRKLIESLGASGVIAATTDADEADSSLKIVVSQTRAGDIQGGVQIEASALLVNARGAVLWPKAGKRTRRYSGETNKVLFEIVKDLLSEIRLARTGGI